MPRLLTEGPGLAVSPDHLLLAVAGAGRLRLSDTRTREEIAHTTLTQIDDPIELGFAEAAGSARLVAFVRREATTEARAYLLPRLELAGQLELIGQVRPAAFIGDRILVCSDAGENPRIVTLAPRQMSAEPIALREPIQLATQAPEERLLVASRDQVECWDPVLRRALYRLNLPVSKPRQAGFAARKRLLWVASAGQIEVFRFSDGRLQLRIELGRRFLQAAGHPESPRLLVALANDAGEAGIEEFDLMLQERREIPLGNARPASFCVIEGDTPQLVIADRASDLTFLALGKLGTVEAPHPSTNRTPSRPAAPSVVITGAKKPRPPREPDDGSPSWRARLGQGGSQDRRGASERRSEPSGGQAALATREEYVEPPTQPRALAVDGPGARSWRDRVVGWAEAAEAGRAPEAHGFLDERSPLGDLSRRFELDLRAGAGLALLYAAWLRGDADGLPAAILARALNRLEPDATSRPDDEACWSEALGRGALGREGLVRARRGRIRLRATVGRFLDGATARIEIVPAAAPLRSVPMTLTSGPWRVALPDEEDRKAARTIARRLGQDVALIELGAPRPAARQLLEARLNGAIPLLCGDPAALEQALDQLPPVLMLVGYRGYCPEALANLPVFEID